MDWLRKLLGRCVHEYELVRLLDHYERDPASHNSRIQCVHRGVACTHILRCSRCGRVISKTINFK